MGRNFLNSSQWGYIDQIEATDGGNVGIHKHMAITTVIKTGV